MHICSISSGRHALPYMRPLVHQFGRYFFDIAQVQIENAVCFGVIAPPLAHFGKRRRLHHARPFRQRSISVRRVNVVLRSRLRVTRQLNDRGIRGCRQAHGPAIVANKGMAERQQGRRLPHGTNAGLIDHCRAENRTHMSRYGRPSNRPPPESWRRNVSTSQSASAESARWATGAWPASPQSRADQRLPRSYTVLGENLPCI